MLKLLPPISFHGEPYRERKATQMIQLERSVGVPLDFAMDNLNFAGTITREYYERCMAIKRHIEAERSEPMPTDLVQLHIANGEVLRERCHIEDWSDALWNVCLGGTTPYVNLNGNVLHSEASGGPWEFVPKGDLKDTGLRIPRTVWTFGGFAGADRGLYFRIHVKLWTATLENHR